VDASVLSNAGERNDSLVVLWENAERAFCRLSRSESDVQSHAFIPVLSGSEHLTLERTNRLVHEYELKDHLDSAWALRPLEFVRERGQAMVLTVLLLAVGAVAVVYTLATPAKTAIENDKKTAAAMVQARDALVGWSVARSPIVGPPSARPGELPCPDIDNSGTDAGGCAAGAIGRVPWRSLGIAEPKDGAGETLWYAIADQVLIVTQQSSASSGLSRLRAMEAARRFPARGVASIVETAAA
jgi:hypothetical protein